MSIHFLNHSSAVVDITFVFEKVAGGQLPKYGTLIVSSVDASLVSHNYAEKEIGHTSKIALFSRNSPAVLDYGRIFLHGAFQEFNHKPFVFLTKHLFRNWLEDTPNLQLAPAVECLRDDLLAILGHRVPT